MNTGYCLECGKGRPVMSSRLFKDSISGLFGYPISVWAAILRVLSEEDSTSRGPLEVLYRLVEKSYQPIVYRVPIQGETMPSDAAVLYFRAFVSREQITDSALPRRALARIMAARAAHEVYRSVLAGFNSTPAPQDGREAKE
jgi:hypothetical protein